MSFTDDLSWGASFGTQMLAEISLLEAQAKQCQDGVIGKEDESKALSVTACSSSSAVINASNPHSQDGPMDQSKKSLLSTTQDEQEHISAAVPESASVSLCLPCSDPSEQRIEASGSAVAASYKKPTSLSTHSPLSCSTPVNLRRASLRSGSALLKLQLTNWGLPASVVKKYAEKKITTLFPWQVECLQTGRVLNKGNLIYSAPTSSGKTLVAELLMLKTIFEQKKKGKYLYFAFYF